MTRLRLATHIYIYHMHAACEDCSVSHEEELVLLGQPEAHLGLCM